MGMKKSGDPELTPLNPSAYSPASTCMIAVVKREVSKEEDTGGTSGRKWGKKLADVDGEVRPTPSRSPEEEPARDPRFKFETFAEDETVAAEKFEAGDCPSEDRMQRSLSESEKLRGIFATMTVSPTVPLLWTSHTM